MRILTRQRAEASEHKLQKRLSKGLTVAAPTRVTSAPSLEKRPEEVIEQALGEARSRDPTGRKSWVVLVDGHRSQLKTSAPGFPLHVSRVEAGPSSWRAG